MARKSKFMLANLMETITDALPVADSVRIEIEPEEAKIVLRYSEIEGKSKYDRAREIERDLSAYFGQGPDLSRYYLGWIFFGVSVGVEIGYSEVKTQDLTTNLPGEVIE